MAEERESRVETGRTIEVYRGRAIVELDPAPNRGQGAECRRCGLCSAGRAGPEAPVELRASVPPDISLAPGDRVEVRIRLAAPGGIGKLLLGLPLAAFLGTALALYLAGKPADFAAKSGFVALLGGFVTLLVYHRARGARAAISRKL